MEATTQEKNVGGSNSAIVSWAGSSNDILLRVGLQVTTK
jgi:hypothetical protein